MARIPLDEIRDRIRRALDGSFLRPFVSDVSVEPADDIDDATLRVLIYVHDPRRINPRDTNDLVRRLRLDLMADDDRFPVFQFPEAA